MSDFKGTVKCPKCGKPDRVKRFGRSHWQCMACADTKTVNGEEKSVPFNFRTPEENKV